MFSGFLGVILAWSITSASPIIGNVYSLKLVDVDGRTLSTSDNVVTVLVLTTRPNLDKAQEIGDRIPDRCLGNPNYRMVTVIQFGARTNLMQYLLKTSVRHGLDSEATRLKKRYMAKGLSHDARSDIHAVADFNDQTAAQLSLKPSPEFRVLILSGNGTLLRDWTHVPGAEELTAALP